MAETAPGGRRAPDQDHFRHSYSKDKAQLVRRLCRIEGQVRGIARMIEREEYCVDILQQTAALRAAVDARLDPGARGPRPGLRPDRRRARRGRPYVDEVVDVVRRTLGRPVAGHAAGLTSTRVIHSARRSTDRPVAEVVDNRP